MRTAEGDYVVADFGNNSIRVVTSGGVVRTLAGNGKHCFVDGQGAAALFNGPIALAVDVDDSILVTDYNNHAVRRVTMEGVVSTVAGNWERGYTDGECADVRFNHPCAVVVHKDGTIVVADMDNHCLRGIGRHQVVYACGRLRGGHGLRRWGRRALQ